MGSYSSQLAQVVVFDYLFWRNKHLSFFEWFKKLKILIRPDLKSNEKIQVAAGRYRLSLKKHILRIYLQWAYSLIVSDLFRRL